MHYISLLPSVLISLLTKLIVTPLDSIQVLQTMLMSHLFVLQVI